MTEKLDRNAAIPLYVQLEEKLRADIAQGKWKANDRFPSENELNQMYGPSRMTVRSVVNQLVNDGLLYRVQGKGTFVASPKISTRSPAFKGIRAQLEAMGYETSIRVTRAELIVPSQSLREKLQLTPADKVYVVERVRTVSGIPISIHTSSIPYKLAPNLLAFLEEREPLSATLEKHFHLKMFHTEETLESVPATKVEAEILQIKRGFSLILMEDLLYNEARLPYERTKILFRGDQIKLKYEYTR